MSHEPAIMAISLALETARQNLGRHAHCEPYPGYIAEIQERAASLHNSIHVLSQPAAMNCGLERQEPRT